MLVVLLTWVYVGIFIYILGNACMRMHNKLIKCNREVGLFEIIFAGIMVTTMYAQIYSLFGALNIVSNVVLIVATIIYALFDRKYLGKRMLEAKNKIAGLDKRFVIVFSGIIAIMIIVYSACSSGVEKLIDTEWYHAQNIRWLEEYGCVKGVANLLFPLGFNSPQHYFDAMFSMKDIFGQSIRFSGGLFGVVICLHGLFRVKDFFKHEKHIADAIAIGEIIYSVIVTAFFADPYTDTLPNILILFIATEWFSMIEEQKTDLEKMSWLCVFGVFATSVKSSAAMVVLFVVYPAYLLIKEKKVHDIVVYIIEGILICIPYFVTNIIVTGYPVYLLSAISFDCKWKIDPAILKYAVDDMKAFARMPGVPMSESLHCGLRWIPTWFKNDSISHQILYMAIVVLIVYDLVCSIWEIASKKKFDGLSAFTRVCIYLGLVYWMCTIPQVKYCWSYLIIPVCVVPMSHDLVNKKIGWLAKLLAIGVGVLYLGFYSLRTLGYTKDGILHNPVKQADYLHFTFDEIEVDGLKFYIKPEEGDIACGYYVFPQLDSIDKAKTIVLGDSYKEGFYFR